jgi:hypothetical protein
MNLSSMNIYLIIALQNANSKESLSVLRCRKIVRLDKYAVPKSIFFFVLAGKFTSVSRTNPFGFAAPGANFLQICRTRSLLWTRRPQPPEFSGVFINHVAIFRLLPEKFYRIQIYVQPVSSLRLRHDPTTVWSVKVTPLPGGLCAPTRRTVPAAKCSSADELKKALDIFVEEFNDVVCHSALGCNRRMH